MLFGKRKLPVASITMYILERRFMLLVEHIDKVERLAGVCEAVSALQPYGKIECQEGAECSRHGHVSCPETRYIDVLRIKIP